MQPTRVGCALKETLHCRHPAPCAPAMFHSQRGRQQLLGVYLGATVHVKGEGLQLPPAAPGVLFSGWAQPHPSTQPRSLAVPPPGRPSPSVLMH